ncbi:hypothetical protein [Aurantimonas sp. 22II-16-19i]|uniref:FitA-like ribbon-helix-helix domain-containing protein n=1 Tax=Aurantimonas sp. 22II-16-19i TaxID=1317114 RepID=UPI0009F801F6|nr:hypothetical protein [Aurantimonas sp. 22II-16-19i]ORE97199.1 hypothetical protein ATO4_10416 [Aurantimonas sp. 22II-16-19i]
MTSITITNIDGDLSARLRRRATEHDRSIEEEASLLLKWALEVPEDQLGIPPAREHASPPRNLYEAIRRHIDPIGGVDLELPAREMIREPPTFD